MCGGSRLGSFRVDQGHTCAQTGRSDCGQGKKEGGQWGHCTVEKWHLTVSTDDICMACG